MAGDGLLVELDALEIEIGHAGLPGDGRGDVLLRAIAQLDQELADGHLSRLLNREGLVHLLARDRPHLGQHATELAAFQFGRIGWQSAFEETFQCDRASNKQRT